MTRFTVVWLPLAINELARQWLVAEDRAAVSEAADAIDQMLVVDPESKGESIGGKLRILRVPPLLVLFRVSELDRLVEVSRLKRVESQLSS